MDACCIQPFVEKHYKKIELAALAAIAVIFLTFGTYLLKSQLKTPASFSTGVFLEVAAGIAFITLVVQSIRAYLKK
ncbi:MAG: hypothetical protein ACKVOH_02020 [Chlamydiales bacterium]